MEYSREEVWLGRSCVVIGVKQLLDGVLEAVAILKVESGLRITTATLPESVLTAYAVTSFAVGLYFIFGGAAISRLAFKRGVPLLQQLGDVPLPSGTPLIALIFRIFGALQFIEGISALVRYLTYLCEFRKVQIGPGPDVILVERAWTIEHFTLAGVLLMFGGAIASIFTRGKKA